MLKNERIHKLELFCSEKKAECDVFIIKGF